MGLVNWIKNWANKFLAAFEVFMKDLFDQEMKLIIGQFGPFALQTIVQLSASDLTSDAKRKAAFETIKANAIAQGKSLADSMINTLIELALSKYKASNNMIVVSPTGV
jgi:hypothetical protein